LRVYGHQSVKTKRDCKDTKLEVPFERNNHDQIKEQIRLLKPKGTTLIAYSLEQAAYDFPSTPGVRNIIILITDGIEECNGDPCAVSTALQKQGVILRPFIIGLGLTDAYREQFDCVGRFFEAKTEEDFEQVLNVVVSQAVNNTSCQVNLLDAYGRPTETDVNMTFTDSRSGKTIYNYMHTLNYRGYPDTLYVDPSYSYDLKVHTIPPQYKKGIKLIAGKHNTIAVDAPQGSLNLKIDGVTNYKNLQALVIDPKTKEIVNVQDFNANIKYITGSYDVEILTLPRLTQKGVSIVQDKSTTLQVRQPGKVNVICRSDLVIAIYRRIEGELVLVKNLQNKGNQNVTVLQPGKYELIYRLAEDKDASLTKTKGFTVSSGEVTHINIR
jgi:Ca-activated chloride channel family protein